MHRHPILYSFLFIGVAFAFLAGIVVVVLFAAGKPGTSVLPFGGGSVAVARIEGPIFDSSSTLEDLEDLRKDNSVKAVVLRIDSPGGAVAPSQEIFEEVKKLKSSGKVVVVSMGTVAASGGYYIACAGDWIVASPGTITGSIGVIMEGFGFAELLKFAKVESRVLKSGAYKDIGNPFRDVKPFERDYLQSLLDNMYGQFKSAVAEQRKIPADVIDGLAEGKVYTGQMALANKLIDGFGTIYDAIDIAKKKAGLPEKARVIWPRDNESPLSFLIPGHTKSMLSHLFRVMSGETPVPVWMLPQKIGS